MRDETTVAASTDWRGEFVKTGPGEYDWTTMAYFRGDESSPIPYALGFCPLSAQFIDCDSWWGAGTCQFYGFFSPDQDPFVQGFLLQTNDPLEAFFQRMPMTYPSPWGCVRPDPRSRGALTFPQADRRNRQLSDRAAQPSVQHKEDNDV